MTEYKDIAIVALLLIGGYAILKQVGDMGKGAKDAIQDILPSGPLNIGGAFSPIDSFLNIKNLNDLINPIGRTIVQPNVDLINYLIGQLSTKSADKTTPAMQTIFAPSGNLANHPLFNATPSKIDTRIQEIFAANIRKDYSDYYVPETRRSAAGGSTTTAEIRGLAVGRAPIGSNISHLIYPTGSGSTSTVLNSSNTFESALRRMTYGRTGL